MNFINNSTHNTSDLAQIAIAFANLNDEQKAVVERCINNYAEREGFTGAVLRQLYFLLEAFRKYGGTSDWEKAQKVLEDKAFTIIPAFTRPLIGEHRIHRASDRALQAMVRLNDSKIQLPEKCAGFVKDNLNIDTVVNAAVTILKDIVTGSLGATTEKVKTVAREKAKEAGNEAGKKLAEMAVSYVQHALMAKS